MTRPFLIFLFLLGLAISIKAQTATDSNEGSRISYNSATGVCTLNWWGRSGMSYFIRYSEDLVTWHYLPGIVQGSNHIEGINYQTNGSRLFMQLEIESDPFNTDSDGDGMSDGWEVQNGLNPHSAADALDDADGDGVPNIFEYKIGATDPQDPNSKPAATFTVDPSIPSDAPPVYKKIQSAIDAVASGAYAYISVKPGTYIEDVSIQDKHILLMAQAGVNPVVLSPEDSPYSYAAISIFGDVSDTCLSGLTLRPANANQDAEGIYLDAQDSTTRVGVTNCIIQGFAPTYGGAVYIAQGQAWVTHCTLTGNTAKAIAQGIYVGAYGSLRLRNSILWDSVSGSLQELVGDGATPDITVQSSVVRGGSTWGGINTDPHLTPHGELTALSAAAINQGTPLAALSSASGVAAPRFDIHGEVRQATQPDIGADEFVDLDGHGMPDWWQKRYFGSLGQDPNGNPDSDGANNATEYVYGTDPHNSDTDGDGATDGAEISAGTNPLIADTDGDGIPDGWELAHGLNPLNAADALDDADGDGVPNIFEYKLGATDPQVAASKPVITFTVDPSVTDDAPPVYKKIQTAIDAVALGDYAYISIKPGNYLEDIIINDKHVLLMAQAGANAVILSPASSYASAAIIVSGDSGDTTLSGLTLRPAYPGQTAQGVSISGQNAETRVGITNCIIQGFASSYGGGLYVYQAQAWVTHCTLFGNTAMDSRAKGIYVDDYGSLRLRNSIMWDSATGSVAELAGAAATPDITVQSSIVRGGSSWGGVNTDPQLNVYGELTASSAAAINQGTPLAATTSASGVPAPGYDIHGEVRQVAQPDIGADEFVDVDGDGLPDWWELKYFGNLSGGPGDDPDGDGLTDKWECYFGFDPLNGYTSDFWNALVLSGSLTGDGTWQTDDDHDGLTKIQEMIIGTNPNVWDTFGVGLSDRTLLFLGILPLSHDADGDGLTNAQELALGTNPFLKDTDGDGVPDNLDAFPFDPSRSTLNPTSGDTTPPTIVLLNPPGAVPQP
jgi:hypothetical protein